jgi:hypothetical protein
MCQRTCCFTQGFYDHELGGAGSWAGGGGRGFVTICTYLVLSFAIEILPRSQIKNENFQNRSDFLGFLSVCFISQQSLFVILTKFWKFLNFFLVKLDEFCYFVGKLCQILNITK